MTPAARARHRRPRRHPARRLGSQADARPAHRRPCARSSPTRTSARFTGRVTDASTGSAAVGPGCGRADAARVHQQGAHHRRRAAHARPRRAPDHHGRSPTRTRPGLVMLKGGGDPTLSAAAPGQADAGTATPRGSATWPTRCARPVWRSRPSRSTRAPSAGRPWRRAGIPLDIDGGDIAPMESVMLDGGRTQPVSVDSRRSSTPGARRRPRAGGRARGRPRVRHLRAAHPSPGRSRSRRCSRRR